MKRRQLTKPITDPGAIDEINSWLSRLSRESDSAAAVLAGAFIDAALESLLRTFCVDDSKEADNLFDADQPLGSFGARIRTAYLLGFITPTERDDLRRIKDVRNAFAHSFHELAFDDEPVKSWCQSLKTGRDLLEHAVQPNSRARFSHAAALIAARLAGRVHDIAHARRELLGEGMDPRGA